jgi:hypothetical protein
MNATEPVRIEIEAVRALAHWKARFADEVFQGAKRLAAQSNQPGSVTLLHYRQSAQIALQSLADAIDNEGRGDGQQRAA